MKATLRRKNDVPIFMLIIFIFLALCGVGFVALALYAKMESRSIVTTGNVKANVEELAQYTPTLLIIGIILILFSCMYFVKFARSRNLYYAIDGDLITFNVRSKSHTVNLSDVDYMHLFRFPGNAEFGFCDDIALYTPNNHTWNIIGHSLTSKDGNVSQIEMSLINQYTIEKSAQFESLLGNGQSIGFPMINFDTQKSFDTLLAQSYMKQVWTNSAMPEFADVITLTNSDITMGGVKVPFSSIAKIQREYYKNSIIGAKKLTQWQFGYNLILLNHEGEMIMRIVLPSVFNSLVLVSLLEARFGTSA